MTCLFTWSLENTGEGCARQTTAVVRLYGADGEQVGSDIQMDSTGGLYNITIRPGEIIALFSQTRIEARTADRTKTVNLFPTWTNVRCPA